MISMADGELTGEQRRRMAELQRRYRQLRYRRAARVEARHDAIFALPFGPDDLESICADILWNASKCDSMLGGGRPEFADIRRLTWTAYGALGNATDEVPDEVYDRVRTSLREALERLGDLDIALAEFFQRAWD